MVKEYEDKTFHSATGDRIKQWWRIVERFGIDVANRSVDAGLVDCDTEVEDGTFKNNEFYIGDPFQTVCEEDIEVICEGGDQGLQGYCTVRLKSGHILDGKWRKGKRWGPGMICGAPLEKMGVRTIWGTYHDGLLHGKGRVELNDADHSFFEGEFVDGKLEGKVRGFSEKEGLKYVTNFRSGRPSGPSWKSLHGGAFIYSNSRMSCSGNFSGDDVAFIYSDIETALIGKFENDVMIAARESKILSCTSQGGILKLEFAKPHGEIFRYWPSERTRVLVPPLLQDPYEKKVVEVKSSGISGILFQIQSLFTSSIGEKLKQLASLLSKY